MYLDVDIVSMSCAGMSAKPFPPEKVSEPPVTPEPPETTRRRGCIRHSRAEGGAAGPSQPESRCANRCGV